MWTAFGHQNQKDFLENALKSGKLAHAYLFVGPQQVGKRTIAREFAQKLLGIDPAKPGFNPDLIEVNGSEAKIEDMRKLMAELAYKPYQSKYKIAIIDNFESVGDEAANSILKTLEEPNPSTIIILVATSIKAILPTIVSRSMVLHFSRMRLEEMPKGTDQKLLFEICDGKFGKYKLLTENDEQLKQIKEHLDFWRELRNQGVAERILAIKKYSELEAEEIDQAFSAWLDAEHHQAVGGQSASQSGVIKSCKNLDLLSQSISGLSRNFNKKLVLENLFLNVS